MLEADKGDKEEDEKTQRDTLCTKMTFLLFQTSSFHLLRPGTKIVFMQFSISTDYLNQNPSPWG